MGAVQVGRRAVKDANTKPRVIATVFSKSSLSRCVPIALFVGTVLSAVNQAGVILGGEVTVATWIRVGTNYVVPFCVSSSGFYASQRAVWRSRRGAGEPGGPIR